MAKLRLDDQLLADLTRVSGWYSIRPEKLAARILRSGLDAMVAEYAEDLNLTLHGVNLDD